ncbi:MAG: hypothetical protein ACYSWU_27905 [Planctomycetota bacterium]|jgi:hypothetical protein
MAASIREAVAWAAENYEAVVEKDSNGRQVFLWEKARTEPPSDIAKSYMKFAANNPANFFSQIVPKFLGGQDDDDEISAEDIEEERKSIAQMRAILKKYNKMEKQR